MSRYWDDFIIEDEELLHYGVKGMKWRKRLARGLYKSASDSAVRSTRYHQLSRKYSKAAAKALVEGGGGAREVGFGPFKRTELYGNRRIENNARKNALAAQRTQKRHARAARIKRRLAKFIGGK